VPACNVTQQLLVEISDSGAIGQISVPSTATPHSAIGYAEDQVVGSAEGSPIAVVTVRVGAGVKEVAARFGTGTEDAMEVRDGWAVLATSLPGSANVATAASVRIEALTSSNVVAAQVDIPEAPSYALPDICVVAPTTGKYHRYPPVTHPVPGTTAAGAPMIPAGTGNKSKSNT
jgi:hypothetical protein